MSTRRGFLGLLVGGALAPFMPAEAMTKVPMPMTKVPIRFYVGENMYNAAKAAGHDMHHYVKIGRMP